MAVPHVFRPARSYYLGPMSFLLFGVHALAYAIVPCDPASFQRGLSDMPATSGAFVFSILGRCFADQVCRRREKLSNCFLQLAFLDGSQFSCVRRSRHQC